ncbi:VraH family peptide resistance protein [Staphylococcus ratti]|uniref:VraH family protein n=1 Tax=Staphylococcus ratti TaxID=2892440 RepID=A0ABY3PDJ4_9STAP|nr:VraH family protein [Staphylococcus ratti]UEX90401.1 VraH family protein [Staphylococcus ratti]
MSIKQFFDGMINRRWTLKEIILIAIYTVVISMILTPLIGIPVGIGVFYYFHISEEEKQAIRNQSRY